MQATCIHIHMPSSLLTALFKLLSNLNFEEYTIQVFKEPPRSFLHIEHLIVWMYHRPVPF